MKYKLLGDGYTFLARETVLLNRGIDESLFTLDKSVIEDYNNYDNINEGVELLVQHINNNSNILIVADCDVDGVTSFAILYNYLKEEYGDKVNLEFVIHEDKEHGLSKDIIIEDHINLVILPDAGSNDYFQHKCLKDRGVDVLILDHHDCEKYSENAIVINNQLSNNVHNKNLAGVGVTYKFLKALDGYLFNDKADYYLDLVALGNVADVMLLTEKETRYFVYKGLENVNNTFLKALIDVNSFDLNGKYNIDKLGWVIAPKLNGTIRSGSHEEKLNMYKAFISNDYDFCVEMAKKCRNIKARQDNAVKSGMKKLRLKINTTKDDRVLIVDAGKLNKSFTGLVAGKLADMYSLPVLLYRESSNNLIGGSGRGFSNITDTFKEDLLASEYMTMCQGHESAFGWTCDKNNIDGLRKYLNELYKDKEITNEKTYDVEFELTEDEIDMDFVASLGELEDEWGNGLNAPLTIFKDITLALNMDNIKRTNIIFEVGGIKFIKKFATNVLKEKLIDKFVNVNIIGKCIKDTYNNSFMVEIVDIDFI